MRLKRMEIDSKKRSVRLIGLEPTRLTTPDPKSGVATNYTTGAITSAKVDKFLKCANLSLTF